MALGLPRPCLPPHPPDTYNKKSALGRIRTCDTRFRKPMLYPLSYEGGTCRFG